MPQQISDSQFKNIKFTPSEISHLYGGNVHVLSDPLLLSKLAELGSPDTYQPAINDLVSYLYSALIKVVISTEFPTVIKKTSTRMVSLNPNEGFFEGPAIDTSTKVVCASLLRAGSLPTYVCYQELNRLLDPKNVRQDHITISRQTDSNHKVTGSKIISYKIGGPIDDAIVLFPDPMGATGGTLIESLKLYKSFGTPKKVIALHTIITPEYLRCLKAKHPEVIIYALRLDRGLSSDDVLKSKPGEKWDQERGLNDIDYIVPGAGGLGEILNNAFV